MKHQLLFLFDFVLPNIVLQNAMPPEMGIVNYLNTLFSDRLTENTFFEENLEADNGPMKLVFGDSLGTWPNSLRHGRSHLNHSYFKDIVEITENSLFFGRQNVRGYVYPIKVSPHFNEFTGHARVGSRLNGEYFWKHTSERALKDIKDRKAVIFLDWGQENFIEKHQYDNLHYGLRRSGIPKEQIILAINSFNAKEVYESWYAPHERLLEVHNWPFLLNIITSSVRWSPESYSTLDDFNKSRNTIRKNYFLFKIHRPREYRVALLQRMSSDNLLSKADWSCLDNVPEHVWQESANKYRIEFNPNAIENLKPQIPHTLQDEPNSNFGNIGGWKDPSLEPYRNSYFYVCTEADFGKYGYKSLSEKIFKPIVNFQPFVFASYKGALQLLRDLGFKTFSPYIDESYDDEPDEAKRLDMIYTEIKKLCAMDINSLHNWYWSMEETLLHNRNHLLTIYETEPNIRNLIKCLYDKSNPI